MPHRAAPTFVARIDHYGDGPLVATAIHDGHELRPSVADAQSIDEMARLREEDPFTGVWTSIGHHGVRLLQSRFEFDANRPRHRAVYRRPEDAWGLSIWKPGAPTQEMVDGSLAEYDTFYDEMFALLRALAGRHGFFVVYDLHSYNHLRDGFPAPAATNPTVNLGTGTLDRSRWGGVADAFSRSLRRWPVGGTPLDVRENVRFRGGEFSRWVNQTFAGVGCALAIEVKKVFMNERTAEVNPVCLQQIGHGLWKTIPSVLAAARDATAGHAVVRG